MTINVVYGGAEFKLHSDLFSRLEKPELFVKSGTENQWTSPLSKWYDYLVQYIMVVLNLSINLNEVASGMRLGEYMKREIFEPLGMTGTTFNMTPAVYERLYSEYVWNEGKQELEKMEPVSNAYVFTPNYESGGAGLISTFEDYFKFVETIINGGTTKEGYQLIRKESLNKIRERCMTDEMLQDYHRYRQWGSGYAFGVRVQLEQDMCPPGMDVGVFDINGAAGGYAHFDMEKRLAILYFQHVIGVHQIADYVHHEIRDLVYEGIEKHDKREEKIANGSNQYRFPQRGLLG